jgi:hypothetical protein
MTIGALANAVMVSYMTHHETRETTPAERAVTAAKQACDEALVHLRNVNEKAMFGGNDNGEQDNLRNARQNYDGARLTLSLAKHACALDEQKTSEAKQKALESDLN